MMWAVNLGLFFSLLIHVIDQSTDVFAAVLFYFEGHIYTSFITLALVFLPGFCISITELRKTFCTDSCSFIKAIGYLLLSPLWAIIIHIYSFFDERYVQTAIFFKTIEGFVEAGPQLALQLSLLLKGSWAESSFLVIGPVLSEYLPEQNETEMEMEITTTMLPMTTILPTEELNEDVHNGSLVIFDRVYDADARYYFGCLHIASVIVSFISIWSSSVIFNDVENSERQTTYDITTMSFEEGKSCCSKKNVGKIIFGAPFFLFTLIFRAIGLALLICFLQLWSGVIIFGLFFSLMFWQHCSLGMISIEVLHMRFGLYLCQSVTLGILLHILDILKYHWQNLWNLQQNKMKKNRMTEPNIF